LARLALIEILKRSPNPMVLDEDFDLELTDKKHYH